MIATAKLSEHFLLYELIRSDTAIRLGRMVEVPPGIEANLRRLCTLVLEPIRSEFNRKINVLSGYRPPWLNKLTGGSAVSEHMDGRAVDFEIDGVANYEACVRIGAMLERLPVNQLIQEFPPRGWIHVSVAQVDLPPKRQILTARRIGTSTEYSTGLWRAAA